MSPKFFSFCPANCLHGLKREDKSFILFSLLEVLFCAVLVFFGIAPLHYFFLTSGAYFCLIDEVITSDFPAPLETLMRLSPKEWESKFHHRIRYLMSLGLCVVLCCQKVSEKNCWMHLGFWSHGMPAFVSRSHRCSYCVKIPELYTHDVCSFCMHVIYLHINN